MKKLKNKKGITLVALVITIVVLLILAVILINSINNNGIIGKGKKARENYTNSTEEEQGVIDELKTKIDNANKNETLASKIKPEDYGKTINYSAGGVKDWKVFYSDGENVYLIASDYLSAPQSETDNFHTTWKNCGMLYTTSSNPYSVYWDSVLDFQTITDITTPSRLLYSGYTLNSSNDNSKCVSTLLNSTNWVEFKTDKADFAIGGPTIEMYCASWNAKYGEETTTNTPIYCNNTNSNGYYVGNISTPTTECINMSSSEGYNDTLYYPH